MGSRGWLGDRSLARHADPRDHHDIEVVIGRADKTRVLGLLPDAWELRCIDPLGSGWTAWAGHRVKPPAFQLQARNSSGEFDLFLETVDGGVWRYRRDDRVELPGAAVTTVTMCGLPVVRPEIQLLYMAKSTEPKNASDFAHAAPQLDSVARAWLSWSLTLTEPNHPWLAALETEW